MRETTHHTILKMNFQLRARLWRYFNFHVIIVLGYREASSASDGQSTGTNQALTALPDHPLQQFITCGNIVNEANHLSRPYKSSIKFSAL